MINHKDTKNTKKEDKGSQVVFVLFFVFFVSLWLISDAAHSQGATGGKVVGRLRVNPSSEPIEVGLVAPGFW
jgi:hypothetical protein